MLTLFARGLFLQLAQTLMPRLQPITATPLRFLAPHHACAVAHANGSFRIVYASRRPRRQ
jgi:hypothetical protein